MVNREKTHRFGPSPTMVDVRKATNETGYLLSVTRFYADNAANGSITFPGPKCSNLKTARDVAQWIACNLGTIGESE